MLGQSSRRSMALGAILSVFLLSCVIEEDLRINSDGSGTYRVKISIPKELGDFGDLRKEVEKDGFQVEQEGETEKERFIVFRKAFTDVASLSDSNNSFALTMTDSGFLRREYHLRARLQAVNFGAYKRRIVISMPGKVQSATAGEVAGGRVTWEASRGGPIEVVATAFYLPVSRNQKLFGLIALLGVLLLIARRRQLPATAAVCPACNTRLVSDARFCRACGAVAPVPET